MASLPTVTEPLRTDWPRFRRRRSITRFVTTTAVPPWRRRLFTSFTHCRRRGLLPPHPLRVLRLRSPPFRRKIVIGSNSSQSGLYNIFSFPYLQRLWPPENRKDQTKEKDSFIITACFSIFHIHLNRMTVTCISYHVTIK